MAEFVAADYTEDWSLQAIVRGSSGEFSKVVDVDHDHNSFLEFSGIHQTFDQEFFASFPEFFDMAMDSSDGLEEFYKPFYSLPGQSSSVVKFQERGQEDDVELEKQNQNQESDQSSGNSGAGRVVSPAAYTPKYKRRKNHHKRVVIQVSAEGLSSDKWAWRKYGQKPIKGSPYPRSYYRCSSSKGCLARKQVEQSCVDPEMFIITYTAEHSHSQPTRRNSLSGTVRQKFPSPKSPYRANNIKQEKLEEYSSTTHRSPKTLVHFSSTKVDFPQAIKREDSDETRLLTGKVNDTYDDFEMPDMFFNDEFFSGLEDFDDFISEQPMSSYTSATKISVRSCS